MKPRIILSLMGMILRYLLWFSISCFYFIPSHGAPHSYATDEEALLTFKSLITSDPTFVIARNWSREGSFCDWVGVSCNRHGRVATLSLPGMGLNGTLPPQIGNLSFLVQLDLSGNIFHGNLPSELGQLHRLRSINLQRNFFSGAIPEELGFLSRLQRLSMRRNQLSGPVPEAIFNISSLKRLNISENRLSGSLPRDVCRHLGQLEEFDLSFNNLSGKIPASLSQCTALQILGLSNNRFSGSIPQELGNLTMLRELYLGFNTLEGKRIHHI